MGSYHEIQGVHHPGAHPRPVHIRRLVLGSAERDARARAGLRPGRFGDAVLPQAPQGPCEWRRADRGVPHEGHEGGRAPLQGVAGEALDDSPRRKEEAGATAAASAGGLAALAPTTASRLRDAVST